MGVTIDTNLIWQCQVNDFSIKLNRAKALLFKIRNYVAMTEFCFKWQALDWFFQFEILEIFRADFLLKFIIKIFIFFLQVV